MGGLGVGVCIPEIILKNKEYKVYKNWEIPKGYIYFSMAFAFLVDVFQMKMNKKN